MNIINATPMSYNLGMNDVSGKQLLPQPLNLPSHLPKTFVYARKGKPGRSYLVVGDSRTAIFGAESFDELGKYFNHATAFANVFNKAGNPVMMERIVPDDAPPPAGIRMSLDLLQTQVQDYERNVDGSYKLDADGSKIPTAGPTAGYLGKWVAEAIPVDEDGIFTFGKAVVGPGDQTDGDGQSTRFPFFDFLVSSEGEWGNDQGISFWVQTQTSNNPVDTRLLSDQGVYPFQIAVKSRADSLSTPKAVSTLTGATSVPFVLKPGVVDRNTGTQLYLGDVFVPAFQDVDTPGISPTVGIFDQLYCYQGNIDTALQNLYSKEQPQIDTFSDFDGTSPMDFYRLNPFTARSSSNVPYHTFQLITGTPNSVRIDQTTTIFAKGGGDGTMLDSDFANLVKDKLIEYGDKNSLRQDAVNNPENIFWDSGFPVDVKKAMANFIAIRKDTFVQVSTHTVDQATAISLGGGTITTPLPSSPEILTDDQERSIAITLASVFQGFPESEDFGTPTVRASIIAGSAVLLNSKYTKRLPISIDRAAKWASYMGASNGKWVPTKKPDVSPNNQVSSLRNLNVVFRPADARYKDWDAGMVWPEPYSMDMMYFPQHQTVYPDDTSVLNSAITAFACAQLTGVANKAHRDFTGRSDLSKDQIAEGINNSILAQVDGKFDSRFIIKPETTYTTDDNLRGYSWTTVIKLGAPMMKTVQTFSVETYRAEDLQAA